MRTHYEMLEVREDASDAVIRAAFRVLAQQWHPDKNPEDTAKAQRRFQAIQQAYKVLSDPEARARYDRQLIDIRQRRHDVALTREHPRQPMRHTARHEAGVPANWRSLMHVYVADLRDRFPVLLIVLLFLGWSSIRLLL